MPTYPAVVAEFRANVAQAVQGVSEYAKVLGDLDKVFASVAEATATFDARMERVAEVVQASRGEFTALSLEARAIRDEFETAAEASSAFSKSVQGLGRSTSTLSDRLAATDESLTLFTDRFASADASMTAFGDRVTTLNGEMAALRTELAGVSAGLGKVAAEGDAAAVGIKKQETASKEAAASMGEMRSAMLMVGAAFGITDFAILKMAGSFQANMTRLQTEAGLSTQSIQQFAGSMSGLEQKVLEVATATGYSGVQISHSLYEPVSAGLSLAQALDVVRYAAEESKISGADLETTTTALTAVMKNFGDSIASPEQGMASLNAIVGTGMGRFNDFAQSVKNWAPTASAFGVSLDSVGAALAFMTDRGESFQTAGTKLNQVMAMMVGQTTQAGNLMAGLGLAEAATADQNDALAGAMAKAHVTTSQLAEDIKKPDGLYVALTDLKTRLEQSGVSADAANSILVRAFGGGRQFRGLEELISNTDQLRQKFEQIQHDETIAHFEEQWQHVSHNFQFESEQMIATLKNFGIALGSQLMPAASGLMRVLTGLFDGISGNKAAVDAITAGFAALAVALPVAAVGMFIAKMSETAKAVTTTTLQIGLLAAGFEYGVTHIDSFSGQLVLLLTTLSAVGKLADPLANAISSMSNAFSGAGGGISKFAGEIQAAEGFAAKAKVGFAGVTDFLAGPWGIALGLAAAGIALFASQSGTASKAVDELTSAIKQDSGALGENSRQWVTHNLQQSGALDSAQRMGINLGLVTDAAMGNTQAMGQLNGILATHTTQTTNAGKAAQELGHTHTELTSDAKQLQGAVKDTNTAVDGSVKAFQQQNQAASQSTTELMKNARSAVDAAGSQTKLADTSKQVSDALAHAKDEASRLTDQLALLNGGNITAEKGLISFRDSVEKMTQSFKDNGRSIDDNTNEGRKNLTSVLDAVAAAQTHAEAVAKQTGSVEQGTAAFQRDTDALRGVLAQAGLTQGQIDQLVGAYMRVPHDLTTNVYANTAPALGAAYALQRTINGMSATIWVHANGDVSTFGAMTARATGGMVQHFAGGGQSGFDLSGPVSGAGTTSSDSILTMLSDKEYVVRADAVDEAGLSVMQAINDGNLTGARDLLDQNPSVSASGGFGGGLALAAPTRVDNSVHVHLTVMGNVTSERDLVESIRTDVLRYVGRNNGPGWIPSLH